LTKSKAKAEPRNRESYAVVVDLHGVHSKWDGRVIIDCKSDKDEQEIGIEITNLLTKFRQERDKGGAFGSFIDFLTRIFFTKIKDKTTPTDEATVVRMSSTSSGKK